jgi:hypothetical protein
MKGPAKEVITSRCSFFMQEETQFLLAKIPKFDHSMTENKLFTSEEQQFLSDPSFFILKASIFKKTAHTFNILNEQLLQSSQFHKLPAEVQKHRGKISKGENYSGLPWMVLDFPRHFKSDNIFAYRCLFWWANEYSFTLHLSGIYFDKVDLNHILKKLDANYYICVHESPWNYYFKDDNYITVESAIKNNWVNKLQQKKFLKLSCRLPLNESGQIITCASQNFNKLVDILYP